MTAAEAIAFIQECRESHVPFSGEEPVEPGWELDAAGTAEFHSQCVADYDECLAALGLLNEKAHRYDDLCR